MLEQLPHIIMNHVEYTYPNGTIALKDISLNISRGEFIGIMGSNGAGKSTLVKTLNGLIRPQNGLIFINGENNNSKTIAELSKKVGIVFQNPDHQLFSNSVREEIRFSLKAIIDDKESLQEKVDEVLDKFYLKEFENRSPLTLSGGQKKRLALASVICRDPEILIFDEPTLGQDRNGVEFFINLLKKEQNNHKTIIIITHNIEFSYEFIPRTILMFDGKIAGDGPTREILQNKELMERTSLILPQIIQLRTSLLEMGLKVPLNISTQEEMIDFFITIFTSSINDNHMEEN
ncbi:MAG: ABC transporter ATP-binding protein [Promethearchaeota archaeon]|nr:MAG: ABC transporter ATP-binding protein [Candidatus Lokiarchaeota archaeon]